ncbi:MAG: hypothetical protein IJY81_00225 [Lachnospiraceae bacterium]|nr:hypothetical protein [Lachnospiraceae bacterium]
MGKKFRIVWGIITVVLILGVILYTEWRRERIPEGCIYESRYNSFILYEGDKMPGSPDPGDVYRTPAYEYTFDGYWGDSKRRWSTVVINEEAAKTEQVRTHIGGKPVDPPITE